jgi:hypothetical protein
MVNRFNTVKLCDLKKPIFLYINDFKYPTFIG